MKKILHNIIFLSFLGITAYQGFSQTRVKIIVDWEDKSYENRVIVQDPAFQDILTIENPDEPYVTMGTSLIYTGVYDLGCIQSGTYKVILFNANNMPWASPGSITVKVDGFAVVSDTGSLASTSGYEISFNVTSDGTGCSPLPDSDGDGVIDVVDLDDDNDGIVDTAEALGINSFNCTIPALNFFGGSYESGGTGAGTLGAIYRFPNAIFLEPYDVLVEIVEMRNATLSTIDDDTVDNPNYLQARPTFTGNEKPSDCVGCDYPGITFKFTIVDEGTSTPSGTLFRIGGTTWDVDGPADRKESVRYYNPSAYGTDNPTTLDVTDVNGDASEIEMTAGGILEGTGFSTLPQLRAYFQFLSNTFTLRMQNVRTTFTAENTREYGMSFTQCDVLDFKSASLIIVNGTDSDGDGKDNHVDFDADNDGIPDNIEAQSTTGYIMPSATIEINPITGLDVNYDPTAVIPGTEIIPVDTDGDGILDFMDLDSDNDGTPDIEETNMANSIVTFTDLDGDGLDDLFEGANLSDPKDVNDEIDNPSLSVLYNNPTLAILPDTDGDLPFGGDLDYRDAIDVYIESASVDFDGIDDHIAETAFMGGWQDATLMAWIKLDPTFALNGDVAGQSIMRMYVNGVTKKLHSYYITSFGNSAYGSSSTTTLDTDQWYHVAISYEGVSGMVKLYVNGKLESSGSIPAGTLSTNAIYAGPDFNIGRHSRLDNSYFKGAVDEVRVFDAVLTDSQLQQMVYQEIEQDGANVKGSILDKGIMDVATTASVPWANLQAYYPMTNILTGKTIDASGKGRDADLKNIFTVQPQTAPMPYETVADGPWTTEGTWLHGDVWDIVDVANNKDWGIISVKNHLSTSDSHSQSGFMIDAGSSLTVTGNNVITNNWYFQLDGTLDLADDSQLIQTENSDLATSATGKILRRQEGNANVYWYNYWSSPVGTTGSTALSDNNGTGNNPNNSPFKINMLKDGTGTNISFTSAFDEVGKVSDKWLFSYLNGLNYYDWVTLTPSSEIQPGIGYTQKGTGNAGTEQQYIFEGKPNNGTILIAANDVDDDSLNESQQDVTLTTMLVGNPYPSALNTDQFITDNIGVINSTDPTIQGTILLWEQWAGASHWLAEYQGGYGYINLTETARAYQHPDIPIADQVQTQGIKTPTKFIPVGQGFFVEVINDGNIEFNNTQRIFKDENSGESVFFRTAQFQESASNDDTTDRDEETTEAGPMQTIKLEFSASNGATRRFVLGFNEATTDGFDPGYDGGLITQTPDEDMTSILDGVSYVIQAFSPISAEKVIDLNFKASGDHTYTLDIVEIKNIDETQDIFIRDNLENITWDLRQGPYNFTAMAGEDTDRFDIVFQDDNTLSNDDTLLGQVLVFVNHNEKSLYVKGLDQQVKTLSLTNMLGQTVMTFDHIENSSLENGVYIGDLSSGVYLVNLVTQDNLKLNKKIILE